jgi:hypothetical protein
MKKLIVLLLIAFAVTTINAQTPNSAKENFKTKYPNATDVYWAPVKDNTYRVNYTDNNIKHAVVYDKNGEIVSEEMELKPDAAPAGISDYYKKKSNDKNGTPKYTVWQVKDKNGDVSYYSEDNGKVSYFDKEGNYTSKKNMAVGTEKEPTDIQTPKEK